MSRLGMILLFALSILICSTDADLKTSVRSHLSENLKLKCEALPFRSIFNENRCYFAVFRLVSYSDAVDLCSTRMRGATVELSSSTLLRTIMADPSKFHDDKTSNEAKHTFCVVDSGYKCGSGQSMVRGKCSVRADKKMTYTDAVKSCRKLSMELPSPRNDLENQITVGELGKDPAWVLKTLDKRGNNFAWTRGESYARFTTCSGSSKKPQMFPGHQTACRAPMVSVIEKTGYWSNVGQDQPMDVVCSKIAENDFTEIPPKKTIIEVDGPCAELHELDEDTGRCEWKGPISACATLFDVWNNTHHIEMIDYPEFVHVEECLWSTGHPFDNNAVKVVVRRGCLFTGYSYVVDGNVGNQEQKVAEDLVYGAHVLPNYALRTLPTAHAGLTRANCYCDKTEATVNGHVPTPPLDRKCIEHHEFNETTQQCEWTRDPKFCAELHSNDNRRMFLEMQRYPVNRKYDVNHWTTKHAENFHITVTHIVVRQHCFATLYWRQFHEWKTMPTQGYGYYKTPTATNNMAGTGVGTARFVCECIR